jgi:hypothetical protein
MPGSMEKHIPGCCRRVSPSTIGRFVRGQSDAVPGAVDEYISVSGFGDDGSWHAIDLLALDARTDSLESGLLGASHNVMYSLLFCAGIADMDCSRGVGSVAVLQAAEVQYHHVPLLDDAGTDLVMWVRAVGS